MAQYEISNIPGAIDFETKDHTTRTLQNAKNLLMCRLGEIPFDRLRGFDEAMIDMPMEELRAGLMQELDRVMLWEPEVEVVSATATIENGQTVIRCVLELPDDVTGA